MSNANPGSTRLFFGLMKAIDQRFSGWIGAFNPYDPQKLKKREFDPVMIEESPIRRTAARMFILAFGVFLVWAFVAPLDQGVAVSGSVAVEGNRRQVQHPSGGVVSQILVKEGELVKEGQVLLRVNPLNSDANLTAAELQYITLLATESRLRAELAGHEVISWPRELQQAKQAERVREVRLIQERLFASRAADFKDALTAKQVEVKTLTEEARNANQLANEGFMSRAQASAILRNKVVAEAALSQLINGRQSTISAELAEAQKTREALQQRVQSLAFDADLNNIKAPVSGVITGLKVNTVGGVISGSTVLMEVVPSQESLIIQARVPTHLIDKVRQGMQADLRFTAFNRRTTPVVPGVVTLVGADKFASDKVTDITAQNPMGEYYLARIETTPEGQKMLGDHQIQPGMPVDVIVKVGERTFFSYVMKPVTDNFARSFLD